MSAPHDLIIRAERIGKTYRMGSELVDAVQSVDLRVARGEFVSLMGPSGCGKTTLLNLFGCIDVPTSGTLHVFDEDVAAMGDKRRAELRLRRIGFVFQRFYLLPMLTAFENVELPMIEMRTPRRERSERSRNLLERVGLSHRLKHRPHQLSGGEMQRVAIARALSNQPDLIIADEPTGELDRKTGASILALIKELQNGGLTVIMATHDPHAAALGNRVIEMEAVRTWNTASFITKGLRFRPYRTLFLLLGFAVGVMVMTVLLSVGTAVLDQAMDEDLTGGGDIVLLPAGIDVNVLKTGGVTAMNFDIPNARYLTREFFTHARMPQVRNVSPELTRTYATLLHDGSEQLVRVDGVLPSRFTSLWSAFPAALAGPTVSSHASTEYTDPDFIQTLEKIDAFHTPEIDSAQTWAEWHYFNYHDDAGRSLYVSMNALAFEGDIAASGYSRGIVLFQYVDENGRRTRLVDTIPGREIAASTLSPDLTVGLNAVTWQGGSYRLNVSMSDSTGSPVTVELDLEATPHQYLPPVTPLGEKKAFGYVVPVVRGHMTGRVRAGGRTIALDGIGYHDHNWGHFRDAVWDWGVVHLSGDVSILYGRFASSARELAHQPVLFALFDQHGPRPFELTSSYKVEWDDAIPPQPRSIALHARVGQDPLDLKIDVSRRVESETGAGKQGLFRAEAGARSFFIQMEGTAHLTGSIDRKKIKLDGHAFSETFRLEKTAGP